MTVNGRGRREATTAQVVTTEFGALVLTAYDGEERMIAGTYPSGSVDDEDRCWRCDVPPRRPVDAIGLCGPCGLDLRGPGGV